MAILGGFSEEALKLFQEAASEQGFDFSEMGDTYDFTRCVRPDGSAYGTGGKCRKGSEEAKQWSPPTGKKRPPENPTADQITKMSDDDLWNGKASYKPGTAGHQAYKNEIERRRAVAEKLKAREDKAPAPKKMKTDFRKEVEEATAKRKEKEAKIVALQTRIADNKKAWQESEAKVREAKKEFQNVKSQTHGDKSPEARKRRLDAGRALDKAERAAEKASKMFLGAQKAMKMFTMTPEQRKAEREWNKTKKMYG